MLHRGQGYLFNVHIGGEVCLFNVTYGGRDVFLMLHKGTGMSI